MTTHDLAQAPHDHMACIAQALARAESLCAERGQRLTPVRRRVLELVWTDHKPTGAYDILARLAADGTRAAPPTVYRALDFLLEQRLIHRVESMNAFIGCPAPEASHAAQLLICTRCGLTLERREGAVTDAIARLCAETGFEAQHAGVEVKGTCARCRSVT